MGDRVRVVHDGDGRLVAVKSSPPDDPDRTRREAALLSRLQHPGIVDVVELVETDRGAEVVTRWVGSRTAAELPRPLDPARAAGIVLAVAATVADLHRLGVVHGGLDATHVLLDPVGRPVLCGFGHARRLSTSEDGLTGDPRPSTDVAGLGALLLDLVGDEEIHNGILRRPDPLHRMARRHSARRRALRAIAQHATVPDPTCRPGVRAFADGVRSAVPDANLGPRSTPTEADDGRHEDLPESVGAGPRRASMTIGPLLDLLAETADTLGPSRVVARGPASIDAPLATEQSQAGHLYDELDRLRPPESASPKRRRRPIGRLGGVSLIVGLTVLGFYGADLATGDDTSARATVTIPRPMEPNAPIGTSRREPSPPRGTPPSTTVPGASTPVTTGQPTISGRSTELEHQGLRYQVGQPGDVVAVGNWLCTGEATPAVYRPSTGSVFVFSAWPTPGSRAEAVPVLTSTDGRSLVAGPSDERGCAALVLRHADGQETVIDRTELS